MLEIADAWVNVKVEARKPSHPRLFKFMTAETGRKVLESSSLRWSTPGTFNDPFDTQFDLYMPAADEALRADIVRKQWESQFNWGEVDPRNPIGAATMLSRGLVARMTLQEFDLAFGPGIDEVLSGGGDLLAGLQADFREHFKTEKILCLTSRIDSVQMWSHYARDHTGIALEFQSSPFLDSPWKTARPVRYAEELPLLLEREAYSDFVAGRAHLDVKKLSELVIYTKGLEWQNEREWRIASGNGRNKDALFEYVPFHASELKSVILGCRMDPEERAKIIALAHQQFPQAEILKAAKAARAFRIEVSTLKEDVAG